MSMHQSHGTSVGLGGALGHKTRSHSLEIVGIPVQGLCYARDL